MSLILHSVKSSKHKILKMKNPYLITLFLAMFSYTCFAQEIIPNAPANLKIDGKLTEFSDSLTSYDKTTKLNYALAHDANNLYVFVKANGQQEQNKMMAGGISVSVNASGKKKASSTITFPVVDRAAMMAEMRNRRSQGGGGEGNAQVQRTPEERQAEREAMRKKILTNLKEIKVSGLNGISVESISIYNTYGIKTGINYNDKNALIYELAIPLKLVNVDPASEEEIAVNIKLNGLELPENSGGGGGGFGGGGNFGGGGFGGQPTGARGGSQNFSAMFTPTEFWVKAKLSK